jgi:hypothetical protein
MLFQVRGDISDRRGATSCNAFLKDGTPQSMTAKDQPLYSQVVLSIDDGASIHTVILLLS